MDVLTSTLTSNPCEYPHDLYTAET